MSLDMNKPDLVIAWCEKCKEFRIDQPKGPFLEDTVLESKISGEHPGTVIKLFTKVRL